MCRVKVMKKELYRQQAGGVGRGTKSKCGEEELHS